MRYLIMIITLLILLLGCAKQVVYQSKGVFYFEKPLQELTTCSKINPIHIENATSGLYLMGAPLSFNDKVYYPVETSFIFKGKRISQTTIYTINPNTNAIEDSIALIEPNVNRSYSRIIADDDLLIIGIKDNVCHIIKTDAKLDIISEHITNIPANFIAYADFVQDKLRLVVGDPNEDIVMYDILPSTMQVERKRLIAKKYFRYYQDEQNLWFFADSDNEIEVVKADMSQPDPAPIFKNFDYTIQNSYGERVYSAKAAGNNVYFGHSLRDDLSGGVSMLLAIDFDSGAMTKREINGFLSFDVVNKNDRTYLYRTTVLNDKNVLTISEIDANLQESEAKIVFYLSDLDNVGRIYAVGEQNVYLTGTYHQPKAKQIKSTELELTNKVPDGTVFKPFLAIYPLK